MTPRGGRVALLDRHRVGELGDAPQDAVDLRRADTDAVDVQDAVGPAVHAGRPVVGDLDEVAMGPDAGVVGEVGVVEAGPAGSPGIPPAGRGTGCGRPGHRSRRPPDGRRRPRPRRRDRDCEHWQRPRRTGSSGCPSTKQPMMSVPPEMDCSGIGPDGLGDPVELPVVQDRSGGQDGAQRGEVDARRRAGTRRPGRAGGRPDWCRTRSPAASATSRHSVSGPSTGPS